MNPYVGTSLAHFDDPVVEWLLAGLNGHKPLVQMAVVAESILRVALREGVASLLYGSCRDERWFGVALGGQAVQFTNVARHMAVLQVLRSMEVEHLMQSLTQAGVRGLLMKGTPLGYTHYPSPEMRPAADTDLLVDGMDEAIRAGLVLEASGFERTPGVQGGLASTQSIYTKRLGVAGVSLTIDLHWAISNRRRFAKAFRFEELWVRSRALEPWFPGARALGDEDALLLACVHRVAHMAEGSANRLIWLYDIRLLALGLDAGGWESLVARAEREGLADFLWDGLLVARRAFPFPVPLAVGNDLERAEQRVLIPPGLANRMGHELDNWRALDGWRERLQFVREHVLPPAEFMRSRYGQGWLPVLYLHRFVNGAVRRLSAAVRVRRG